MNIVRSAIVALIGITLPTFATAQAPNVTVGGVAYAQYYYQLQDTLNHVNNFDVTRAYINVLGRWDMLQTRVTGDIYLSADGSLAYRLKYAYAAFTPKGSALTYKLGQIHTPWVDWEEALWDYRMQGQVAMERGDLITPLGYLSSSDFGAGVDGKWGPDKINMQVALVNGENYNRAPGDKRKDLMGRVSVRVMDTNDSSRVGGLRLTGYAQVGTPTSGGDRNRLLGMLSYRSKAMTLAFELAFTQDSVTAPALIRRNGRVGSIFGVYHFSRSKAAVIARVDLVDPNTATPNNKQTRFIAGVSYQLTPNLRILGDIDNVSYEGGSPTPVLNAVRSQALFQMQFTF